MVHRERRRDRDRFQKESRRLQRLENITGPGLTKKELEGLLVRCPACSYYKTRQAFPFHECPESIELTDDEGDS